MRRRTLLTAWAASFWRTRVALERVGRMFSRRFGRLMESQMDRAVCRASISERSEYRWKYDFGLAKIGRAHV